MEKQYYSILTAQGELDIAQAISDAGTIKIKKIAIGDGNGVIVVPKRTQTKLVNEVYRNTVTSVAADTKNPQNVVVELNIPPDVGGWYIRELGVYNDRDQLIAVGNYPETYKPILASGSGQSLLIRLILKVQSVDNVELTVDSTTVYATRLEVKPKGITGNTTNAVDMTGHTHAIDKATTSQYGITQLTDSINFASSKFAGSALSVKTAYEKGVEALNTANSKLGATATAVAANKLATPRNIALTGAVSGSANFDGSGNISINTTDNLTIGLVTSTSATGTTNVATTNSNTYLNAVEKRGSSSNSIGSSTKITGINGVSVSSDANGVVYVGGPSNISGNSASATKLQTPRNIALTGAVSGSANFDGSGNISINTADNLTIGLVTSTSATGISNVATSNSSTYLNVVETRGKSANAVGSSTRVTGTGLAEVYSDASGVLTIKGNKDNSKLNTTGDQTLSGRLTVNDILMASNKSQSLSQVINVINTLFTGNVAGFKNIVNSWGQNGNNPLGIRYDFTNPNAWWISLGELFGGLIIQGGFFYIAPNTYGTIVKIPIIVKKTLFAINAQAEGNTESAIQTFSTWHVGGADNKTAIHFLINRLLSYQDSMEWIAICIA